MLRFLILALALSPLAAGCATNLEKRLPADSRVSLVPSPASEGFRLERRVDLRLAARLPVSVPRGVSSWEPVGAIPQGDVYRCTNDVVAIGRGHIHEAYIVVSEGALITGIFLPVQSAFLEAEKPVALVKGEGR